MKHRESRKFSRAIPVPSIPPVFCGSIGRLMTAERLRDTLVLWGSAAACWCGSHHTAIVPSPDQLRVIRPYSTTHRHEWVVLIAGSTSSALCAARPSKLRVGLPSLRVEVVKTAMPKPITVTASNNCGSCKSWVLSDSTQFGARRCHWSAAAMVEVACSGSENRLSACSTNVFRPAALLVGNHPPTVSIFQSGPSAQSEAALRGTQIVKPKR
jgi:hypothetical protein